MARFSLCKSCIRPRDKPRMEEKSRFSVRVLEKDLCNTISLKRKDVEIERTTAVVASAGTVVAMKKVYWISLCRQSIFQ